MGVTTFDVSPGVLQCLRDVELAFYHHQKHRRVQVHFVSCVQVDFSGGYDALDSR